MKRSFFNPSPTALRWQIGIISLACGAIVLQNVPVLAQLTRAQAQIYTVRIDRPNNEDGGSGVLVKREGNRYTVLTNCHVLQTPHYPISGIYQLEINGDRYPVSITSPLCHPRGIDLAIIQFQSAQDYPVPTIRPETNLEVLLNEPSITGAGFNNKYQEPTSGALQGRRFQFGQGSWRDQRDNINNGYDLLHDYATLPGMSGGPIFDAQGNLVAINGETSDEELKDSAAIPIHYYTSWQLPATTLPVIPPQAVSTSPLVTPPPTSISRPQVQAVTVQIDEIRTLSGGPVFVGSGVLVKQEGNEYTVLTNCHLFRPGNYTLWIKGNDHFNTEIQDRYSVSVDPSSVCHSRVDLAILTFTSTQRYSIATLRSERDIEVLVNEQTPITIAGFSYEGRLQTLGGAFLQTLEDTNGYELVHNIPTQPGMSGSPVFDAKGNLIAIHGFSLNDTGSPSLAIPIHYYTNWQNTTALIPNPFQPPYTWYNDWGRQIREFLPTPIDEPAPLPPSDIPPG